MTYYNKVKIVCYLSRRETYPKVIMSFHFLRLVLFVLINKIRGLLFIY